MGALMAMPAWRTRATKIERALLVVVLAMFVPGFGHTETTVVDAAKSGRQAAPTHEPRTGQHAKPAPQSDKRAPGKSGRFDARLPMPIATNPSPRAGSRRSHAVTTTRNPHAAPVPQFTSNPVKATNTSGVSGNTVARRATVPAAIGGPAKYDAKHGAVIGGTVTGRKR
jgi:hypothetical protein